jgi:hypothetical protein
MPEKQNRNSNINPDDSIERLFRKKANEYDISFREEDWSRMEQKLNMRNAMLAYRRKVRWMAAAAVLIIALLGYFTFDNYQRLNQLTEHISGEIAEGPESAPPTLNGISPIDSADSPDETISVPPATITDPGETDPNQRDEIMVMQDIPDRESLIPAYADEAAEADVLVQELTGRRAITHLDYILDSHQISHVYRGSAVIPGGQAVETDRLNDFRTSDRFASDADLRATSRFSFGLVMAPDFSTVGSVSNFYDPGYKIGASVEFAITENLSVSTGVMQTMVRYSAGSSTYNPPVYWAGDISPDEMIGECLLFDIPINLRYNFWNFNRSRIFASAGLSSYVMMNEEYRFTYGENYPGQLENWNSRTGTRHWFSNAGFSLGLEMDLHPSWSLRAEPYIRVPIQEIGWGNVKLYSMGSFVSLNYRL